MKLNLEETIQLIMHGNPECKKDPEEFLGEWCTGMCTFTQESLRKSVSKQVTPGVIGKALIILAGLGLIERYQRDPSSRVSYRWTDTGQTLVRANWQKTKCTARLKTVPPKPPLRNKRRDTRAKHATW